MQYATLLPLLAAAAYARNITGPSCTPSNGLPGLCITTGDCRLGDGSFESGFCKGLPEDVKCCTWPVCEYKGAVVGQCVPLAGCTEGNWTGTLCPGPDNVKCCGGQAFPKPGKNGTSSSKSSTTTTSKPTSTSAKTTTTGGAAPSNSTSTGPGPAPTAGSNTLAFGGVMAWSAALGVLVAGIVL